MSPLFASNFTESGAAKIHRGYLDILNESVFYFTKEVEIYFPQMKYIYFPPHKLNKRHIYQKHLNFYSYLIIYNYEA